MRNSKRIVLATAIAALLPVVSQGAFTNVTGTDGGGWHVDYQYHITGTDNLNGYSGNFYTAGGGTDNSAAINTSGNTIDRVAYYIELGGSGNANDTNGFAFVSFDTINSDASKLGVPTTQSGEFYQQNLTNMHVISNVTGVQTGTYASGGNIEFWPSNYGPNNSAGPANADPNLFDFGDDGGNTGAGFGSMQISNHSLANPDVNTGNTGQNIISFNQWGQGAGDLGIGNQSQLTGAYSFGGPNPDWTFDNNAGNFSVKDIQVLVHYTPEPASFTALGIGAAGLLALRRRAR